MNAVNGWKLSQDEKRALLDPRVFQSPTLELIGGEVGCLLSHISIYQDALNRDLSIIWICEDDVKLNSLVYTLPDILEELSTLDPDWDVLYTDYTRFGAHDQKHRPEQIPFTPIDDAVSTRLSRIQGRYGTHSMLFSKKGYQKLLAYFYQHCFWSPIDVDLQYAELREYSVKESITHVASFPSDTQPWSSLKNSRL
jgi:GR25 family glycosyltransferase involved in LPS biosynthesis